VTRRVASKMDCIRTRRLVSQALCHGSHVNVPTEMARMGRRYNPPSKQCIDLDLPSALFPMIAAAAFNFSKSQYLIRFKVIVTLRISLHDFFG
jgi:hypothetical protein